MAVIYLQHPDHGTKVAISDAEAIHDEEYGWMRYNPAAPAPQPFMDGAVNGLANRRRSRPRVAKEEVEDDHGG
jgi:hypothetical protein